MGVRAADWGWRGKEKACEELERYKSLNGKNEMILDKGNLPRQLFIMERETEMLILGFATIMVLWVVRFLVFLLVSPPPNSHYPMMIPQ